MLETIGLLGLPLGLEVTEFENGCEGGGGGNNSSDSSTLKIGKRFDNSFGLRVGEFENGLGLGEFENGLRFGEGVVFCTENGEASEVN